MILKGRSHKYGDNIDTDVIIPARHLNTTDPQELAQHCLEDLDLEFVKKVRVGDILVVGENFGCGSSREHAPLAIKASGISCVIAKSFARIFFRNAINIGLPLFQCPEMVDISESGDTLQVEATTGRIHNLTKGEEATASPLPDFLQSIVSQGGLVNYIRQKLQSQKSGV